MKEKEKVPMVICGNKKDLQPAYHHVTAQEGKDLVWFFKVFISVFMII